MRGVLGALCLAAVFICGCDAPAPPAGTAGAQVKQAPEQKAGIQFATGSWQDVLELARKQNKPIFVDVYTDWCKPCKKMDAEIFPRKDVGEVFNASFINYKVDAEKGEGPALARTYEAVRAFPTFLFVKGDGVLVYRTEEGFMSAEAFLRLAKLALQEYNAPRPLVDWVREYRSPGTRSKEFMLGYLEKSASLKFPAALAIEQTFALLDARDLKNPDILASMLYAGPKIEYVPNGKLFGYVIAHHTSLDATLGVRSLELMQVGLRNYFATTVAAGGDLDAPVSTASVDAGKEPTEKDLAVAVSAYRRVAKLQGLANASIEAGAKRMAMEYQTSRRNNQAMVRAAVDYVENGLYKLDMKSLQVADAADEEKLRKAADAAPSQALPEVQAKRVKRAASAAFGLRDAAETVYRAGADDPSTLAKAEEWTRRAAEYFPHYSIAAVQAGVLFRQGKEPRAVELMKTASQDPTPEIQPDTRALLKKNVERLDRGEAPFNLWR